MGRGGAETLPSPAGAFAAVERRPIRVNAAVAGRRGRLVPEEEPAEEPDRVGDDDLAVVVDVRRGEAYRLLDPEKEVAERADGIGEVEGAIGVRVAPAEGARLVDGAGK
jgi:hypothetical protein